MSAARRPVLALRSLQEEIDRACSPSRPSGSASICRSRRHLASVFEESCKVGANIGTHQGSPIRFALAARHNASVGHPCAHRPTNARPRAHLPRRCAGRCRGVRASLRSSTGGGHQARRDLIDGRSRKEPPDVGRTSTTARSRRHGVLVFLLIVMGFLGEFVGTRSMIDVRPPSGSCAGNRLLPDLASARCG